MQYGKIKLPFILPLVFLFCNILSDAQKRPMGTVNAKFIDEQKKPVDGLFVQLMQTRDSSLALSSFSGSDGKVQFINVKQGSYFIYITQLGFEDYTSEPFIISDDRLNVVMPDAVLHTKVLNEVTVTAKIPFVDKQPDMTVINVGQSPVNAGGSTMDVLERAPGVIVDQDDNINLQGKPSVTVMIDGKKVIMSGSELADMLRAMPADAIEKIELITNPGPEYDAQGTGGIINIILKKDRQLGINGTVTGSFGQGIYPKANGGFAFNDRTKYFNLFVNYNYSYRKDLKDVAMEQNFYNGPELIESARQYTGYKVSNYFNIIHAGADFYASGKTTFGITTDVTTRKYRFDGTGNSTIDSGYSPASHSSGTSSDSGGFSQYVIDINFRHKYDSAGHRILSASADYMNYLANDVQEYVNNYPPGESSNLQPPLLYGELPFYDQAYIFQADYSALSKNNGKFESGVKTSYVTLDADTKFFLGSSSSAPADTTQTEDFTYNENIIAGYITYSKSLKRGSISAGLRAAQTIATGNVVNTREEINRNYLNWFPHVTYADTLNSHNNLEVSTGTRINRPDYDELNPFKDYLNPTTYREGNPELIPEYVYDVNVSDVYKGIYVFTLSYAGTQNPEEEVHIPAPDEPGITLITQENLQWSNYYGFNISANPRPEKWWMSNNYAEVFYNQYIADVSLTPINTGRAIFRCNSDNNFSIGKKFTLELSGQYSSGGFWGYFSSLPRWSAGSGIMGKFMNERCTIKMNISDIFYTNIFNSESSLLNYNESYSVKRDSRIATLAVTYRFGRNASAEAEKPGKNENMQANPEKGL
ncbi:MAG: outer membrane beta-barrel protein [Bacteroidia bacterium]